MPVVPDDPAAEPRPRVRWITSIPPAHDGGGGHIRQAHLLRAVAEAWPVDLVVAGRVRDERVRGVVATCTEVDGFVPDGARSTRRRMTDLRLATAARFHREVTLHAPVRRDIARRWHDLPPPAAVLVEPAALAPLVRLRRDEHWSITLHNLRSPMAAQLRAVTEGSRQRWLLTQDVRRARRFERWVVGAFDSVVVPSAEDAVALGGRCHVVPNGVDTDRFMPTPLPSSPRILFTGALYTGPNIDAARWLATQILPLVRARVPDATVEIVGMSPPPEVHALGRLPGVAVHADVASVVPHLNRARVAVVPVRVGTGTRLKALEALAAGRPVVGTTAGLAGLGIVDGQHALVVDDTDGFSSAVVELLTDDARAASLVDAGVDLVRASAWPGIAERYRDLVGELMGARASAGGR